MTDAEKKRFEQLEDALADLGLEVDDEGHTTIVQMRLYLEHAMSEAGQFAEETEKLGPQQAALKQGAWERLAGALHILRDAVPSDTDYMTSSTVA